MATTQISTGLYLDKRRKTEQGHTLLKSGFLIKVPGNIIQLACIPLLMATANAMQRQILENQAEDIRHRERQRIVKDFSFTMHVLIETFHTIPSIEERLHFLMK